MSDHPPWPPETNSIGDCLRYLHVSGVFYCPAQLREPWGLTLPPLENALFFHAVTKGTCQLQVGEIDSIELDAGDLLIVPHGTGHALRSSAGVDAPSVYDISHDYVSTTYAHLRHGGTGEQTKLVCGAVRVDHPIARRMVEALPPLLHMRANQHEDWLGGTLALIATEAHAQRPGGETVISRLCDVLVIQAIRSWIDSGPTPKTGWFAALRDPQIGRVLQKIHGQPSLNWNLDRLAATATMSRSVFSDRFHELVGEPPMTYVRAWQMHIATEMLRDPARRTVADIAQTLGFESEATFSRTFKRIVGVSPSVARMAT
jgi:AraC-like DNA-binding protein